MERERDLLPIMNALLAFECAARLGSFSGAARVLGTSQPSVSRHVSNLESHVGCALFLRHNNKIGLTAAGRAMFQAARDGLDAVHAAILECRASKTPSILTIGCTHGFSHLWIMPRFSALSALCNGFEVRVVTAEHGKVLDSTDVDFSIQFCDGRSAPVGMHLFDEEVLLVAAPRTLNAEGLPLETKRSDWLLEMPLIHFDDGQEGWLTWRDWFASQGMRYQPPPDAYSFRNYAFSLQAAAEGKGVALAWRHLLGPYQANGWLEILDFPSLKSSGSYRLVCSEERKTQEIGKRVSDWFKEETAPGKSLC